MLTTQIYCVYKTEKNSLLEVTISTKGQFEYLNVAE